MSVRTVTAEVSPAGRWSWHVEIDCDVEGSWITHTVRRGVVHGSRARADRIARRWARRERARQQRLATGTHEVQG